MISRSAIIGKGTRISNTAFVWDFVHVRENATIGEHVVVGQGSYIGKGVEIQDNCKIQNYSLIYEPATLERGVFIGPGVIFTNDKYPRAVNSDLTSKSFHDWKPVGVYVKEGASIGAASICVAPVVIGRWAMISAGSTVTKDVPDFALMIGSPAKQVGWVGRAGQKLVISNNDPHIFVCPITKVKYRQESKNLLVEAI